MVQWLANPSSDLDGTFCFKLDLGYRRLGLMEAYNLRSLVVSQQYDTHCYTLGYSKAEQCNQRGWFGDECQFQCHCAGNGECSQSGTCSDGCDPEWFGPACQYDVSKYNISGGSADLSWLTDANDTTCNDNGLESVTVALDTPHPLTWVRVVVSDTECELGKFGIGCSENCSDTCAGPDNACNHESGHCVEGCDPGYKNRTAQCNEECENGTYGADCAEECSVHCAGEPNTCDFMNGTCYEGCEIGYKMPLCKEPLTEARVEREGGGGEVGSGGNGSSDETLIAAVVGAVAAVIVIVVIMVEEEYSEEDGRSEISTNIYENETIRHTPVPVEELKAYLHEHSTDSHFKNQFASVPMDTGQSQNDGRLPHNNKKNRYKNIIPYDSTRVRLTTDEKQNLGDYINASYVKDYNDSEIIIASQGPNDAILNDFIRMLWEQNIDRIVMLTNLIEAGKKKCAMYWPESGQKAFGEIKIELLTTRIFAEYIIRHLQLSKGNEPPRDVTQFHFTAWPDKLTPDSPWGLIDFYQSVRTESGTGRLLVHCSAGVGRTGTFIALGSLLKEAEATGKMDFRATLQKMRQYRMHMIQTIAQYIFLHKAVLVGHMTSGTVIKVNDIAARFLSLEGGASGDKSARSYQQEFDDLAAVCDEDIIMPHQQKDEKVQGNSTKSKDRLSNILPNNLYRPLLAAQGGEENKYINAVFVPSLTHNNQDILTQLPLPSTVTDFYRLVTQFEVGLVVAFEIDSKGTDETIGDFLPEDDTKPFNNELFEIKTITLSENTALKEMMLIIQKKDEQGPSSSTNPHRLKFLLCKTARLDPESVLDVAQNIQASRPTQESRIVYMCRNGANFSGLVCIQSILLDRLDVDQTIAVPLVVGAVRAIRPQDDEDECGVNLHVLGDDRHTINL
ncbi:receptor-type tyrosine-protein phosphatase kappa [Plakobranchus ocellatus]|uniref:protein-tyrosine-phosphatase n=1 Tax=Plakobranchus ocellatus TaxID=259542 RepID=A0AAV4D7L4_9GAST|nr:receptor-type tyrosine-protein phosphatase kappa [Plakobranchus ocellatus]